MSRRYYADERLQWLKAVYPKFKNEDWHNHFVYDPTDLKYHPFFYEGKYTTEKIDPSKIVGIKYAFAYNCPSLRTIRGDDSIINWMDLFLSLKRLDYVIDKFKTMEHLIDHIRYNPSTKTVRKYGKHFFTISGQHRLCLAKLIGLKQVEVTVVHLKLDKAKLIRELKTEKAFQFYLDKGMADEDYKIHENMKYDSVFVNLNGKSIGLRKTIQDEFIKKYEEIKIGTFHRLCYQVFYNQIGNGTISDSKEINKLGYLMCQHKYNLRYKGDGNK